MPFLAQFMLEGTDNLFIIKNVSLDHRRRRGDDEITFGVCCQMCFLMQNLMLWAKFSKQFLTFSLDPPEAEEKIFWEFCQRSKFWAKMTFGNRPLMEWADKSANYRLHRMEANRTPLNSLFTINGTPRKASIRAEISCTGQRWDRPLLVTQWAQRLRSWETILSFCFWSSDIW